MCYKINFRKIKYNFQNWFYSKMSAGKCGKLVVRCSKKSKFEGENVDGNQN